MIVIVRESESESESERERERGAVRDRGGGICKASNCARAGRGVKQSHPKCLVDVEDGALDGDGVPLQRFAPEEAPARAARSAGDALTR